MVKIGFTAHFFAASSFSLIWTSSEDQIGPSEKDSFTSLNDPFAIIRSLPLPIKHLKMEILPIQNVLAQKVSNVASARDKSVSWFS